MWRICLLTLGVLLGCSAMLPVLTGDDLQRVETRWPTASLQSLEDGRQKYINRCGGCHSLHLPSEFTEEEWKKALHEMQGRARTSVEEQELIFRYIVAARAK
jgi:hypothetical protein